MSGRHGLAYHPGMLGLRLVLELAALVGFGYWAWWAADGVLRYLAVVAVPLLVATVWGVFATPGDASRSGRTMVATRGPVRLALELTVFFGGAAALDAAGARIPAMVFAVVLVAYHAASSARVGWLLRN
jgi:hypothetical protein